ncbi:MAG: FAD-dependent oxidoreductase [Actinomycetota bacterium]|nr:FAD-dependent oxidoreductase [Actinomycetota bacterium]
MTMPAASEPTEPTAPARAPDPFDVDAVIVGAGFAGLAVAAELHRAQVSFVLLDARDRIGGKAEARLDGRGRMVDTGAQFANDDMTEVLALAAAAGAERVEAVPAGQPTIVPLGIEGNPWADATALLATLGPEHLHDRRTVTQWLGGIDAPPVLRDAVRSAVNGGTCLDSHRIPVSYLAQLNERTPREHDEMQLWFAQTMHSLAQHLAAPFPERIRLGCPARAVHLHDESVDVVSVDQVWHARHVVVATPPSAYASIRFTPDLPEDIAAAAQAFQPGTVFKYLIGYEQAFWLGDDHHGAGRFLTPPGLYIGDVSGAGHATLVAFVGGTTATEWARHSEADRHAAILHHASVAFGDRALQPLSLLERLWAPDEWGGGGYSNVLAAHAPGACDTLAIGLPLLSFASTELAPLFPGYVEGALRAGRAAAAHLLRNLERW